MLSIRLTKPFLNYIKLYKTGLPMPKYCVRPFTVDMPHKLYIQLLKVSTTLINLDISKTKVSLKVLRSKISNIFTLLRISLSLIQVF